MSLGCSIHKHGTELQSSTSKTGDDDVRSINPRRGKLVALRTKAEVEHSGLQTIPAYIVRIPQKSASEVLKAVDALLYKHDKEPTKLQHLRRIVKNEHLALHLRQDTSCPGPGNSEIAGDGHCSISKASSDNAGTVQNSITEHYEVPLSLLVSSTTSLPLSDLSTLLTSLLPFETPIVQTVSVPRYPPTSSNEAEEWSHRYWPTVYKKYNPFGPQPSTIAKAEADLAPNAGRWMGLALAAGNRAQGTGMGAAIGAVVVERGNPVVVAGDGRWLGGDFGGADGHAGRGNPMAHAVMRAIGLVARKRRELMAQQSAPTSEKMGKQTSDGSQGKCEDHFYDKPFMEVEQQVYKGDSIEAGGYLCLDMEIYVTHEPCVMCSMAILHSRFGKVVFRERMVKTGGMCADFGVRVGSSGEQQKDGMTKGLGYGLFWRKELNWRLLAWRWEDENGDAYGKLSEDMHV